MGPKRQEIIGSSMEAVGFMGEGETGNGVGKAQLGPTGMATDAGSEGQGGL